MSTAAVCGLRVFTNDVKQAYLQGKYGLTRLIYLNTKAEDRGYFKLGKDEILLLIKLLYGFAMLVNTGV